MSYILFLSSVISRRRAHKDTQKKRSLLLKLKVKSLFFSVLLAVRPAQYALLRVQRYILLANFTIPPI